MLDERRILNRKKRLYLNVRIFGQNRIRGFLMRSWRVNGRGVITWKGGSVQSNNITRVVNRVWLEGEGRKG